MDHPPQSLEIYAALTEGQLTQVLMNLIVNARDALQNQEGQVSMYIESNAKDITFEVSDNGVGMSMETQHKIFDPFFTTKKEGEGTGLGLHVLSQLVHRVGGNIKLESEINVGSTFSICIPHASTN